MVYLNLGCKIVESGKTMPKMVLNCILKRKAMKRKTSNSKAHHHTSELLVCRLYTDFIGNLEIETRFVHFLVEILKVFVNAPAYPRN
jgi:hypothetical protein